MSYKEAFHHEQFVVNLLNEAKN